MYILKISIVACSKIVITGTALTSTLSLQNQYTLMPLPLPIPSERKYPVSEHYLLFIENDNESKLLNSNGTMQARLIEYFMEVLLENMASAC